MRVAEVRHLEDHLLHVVRVWAHLELADLKEGNILKLPPQWEGRVSSQKSRWSKEAELILLCVCWQMLTRGRGSENPKILRTLYQYGPKEGRMEGRWVHSSITALSKGMRRARGMPLPCHPITSVRQRTKEPTNNQPFKLYIVSLRNLGVKFGEFCVLAYTDAAQITTIRGLFQIDG